MKIITAPKKFVKDFGKDHIFLAGSIEMGTAEEWQKKAIKLLSNLPNEKDIVVFNPRRPDWDSTWEQSIKNKQFKKQVEWELDALEAADCVIVYFDPKTKSPITMLELGLFSEKCVVVCPDGFWRKGNIDIVCKRYDIRQYNSLEDVISDLYI